MLSKIKYPWSCWSSYHHCLLRKNIFSLIYIKQRCATWTILCCSIETLPSRNYYQVSLKLESLSHMFQQSFGYICRLNAANYSLILLILSALQQGRSFPRNFRITTKRSQNKTVQKAEITLIFFCEHSIQGSPKLLLLFLYLIAILSMRPNSLHHPSTWTQMHWSAWPTFVCIPWLYDYVVMRCWKLQQQTNDWMFSLIDIYWHFFP